jgi:hypothetical protein
MKSDTPVPAPRRLVVPPLKLYRCPACSEPSVPILSDSAETEFWAICSTCSFEGRFPANSRASSRVRRWLALETRRLRESPRRDDPQPRLSRVEYGAEVGGVSGGG